MDIKFPVGATLMAIALAGCGSALSTGHGKETIVATASGAPSLSSPSSPGQDQPGPGPSPSGTAASGIASVALSGSTAADGSAASPTDHFNHATDRKLIAVLTLADLKAGTKLSYIRYLDGKFAGSKSAKLAKPSKHFYFEFAARPGKDLVAGAYRLRFYVNDRFAAETRYTVS